MKRFALASVCLFAMSAPAMAVEGMFTPDQLPEIADDLREAGLALDPNTLTDLTAFPMGAVVSLGGCTASFVSPEGLVVTNHHCVRGSIQYNSTEENNYLADGFLAADRAGEVPAAPGSRIYVTTEVTDVTERVNAVVNDEMTGAERYAAIDAERKAIIAECEEAAGYRCQVGTFFGGLQYKLIKQMEIRDVRLVYAPGDNVGKYGGDIDNWMWPRHTGDFGFYRAYVGPDGQPADYSADNVPYEPEHVLEVSAAGLDDGDFVMVAGYPGSTSRYERRVQVEYVFDWFYPNWINVSQQNVDIIMDTAPEGSDARIRYESSLAGLNNYIKNREGQLEGARRVGLVELRREREAALDAWIAADPSRAHYAEAISALDALTLESAAFSQQNFWYNYATNAQLLGVAERLYRLAHERELPDAQRERGFQERDMGFFRQSMQRVDRRYDAGVDKAIWLAFIENYINAGEATRVAALDEALNLGATFDEEAVSAELDTYYANTVLTDAETRLSLMEASVADLEAMDDPFMQLAVALYETDRASEATRKEQAGALQALQPAYMEAIIAWQRSQGEVTYPDANSTLRITYGSVLGGSPRDGMAYLPFTTLEGILEKDSGIAPFDAPQAQLDLIEAGTYGPYELESIGSVPVNYLTDLDSTGGNSGSATLNAEGQLVGLLFDGTIESVNSDWHFDPRTTRSIHVDTRYMLWIMDYVDNADYLIEEMNVVGE